MFHGATVYKEISTHGSKSMKTSRKPFAKLPITSPWKYKVPILNRNIYKTTIRMNDIEMITGTTQTITNNICKHQAITTRQYQNYFRLRQLFPMVHPAIVHRQLLSCGNDFNRMVDKFLYLRSCDYITTSSYHPEPPINHIKRSTTTTTTTISNNANCQVKLRYYNLPMHSSLTHFTTRPFRYYYDKPTSHISNSIYPKLVGEQNTLIRCKTTARLC